MYYSYVEIEYVATSFSPARMDLALKLLSNLHTEDVAYRRTESRCTVHSAPSAVE
jgi:hypothetical protein